LFLYFFWAFFSASAAAKPDFFQLQRAGSLRAFSSADYFATDGNYTADRGTTESLSSDGSYKNLQLSLGGQYALTPRWYAGADLSWARAESAAAAVNRTNAGLNEASAWMQYVGWIRPIWIVPEVLAVYPFDRIDTSRDETLLGEGAIAVQAGAWLTKDFGSWAVLSYLGAKFQDEDRATLALYRIGAEYQHPRFSLGLGLQGEEVLIDDKNVDSPEQRTVVTNRVNAGSLKYFAINPTLVEAKLWTSFRFSKESLMRLSLADGIDGANAAQGLTARIELQYDFRMNPAVSSSTSEPESGFQMQQEKYDPSLFENEPPPRRRPSPKPKGPSEQQLLNETMKGLENP
jgi:hypothetical protein